jgi:hypothetical protein
MFENAPIISRYSRAQAIADGVLVDLTEAAKAKGFKLPVAITATAFDEAVRAPTKEGETAEVHLSSLFAALRAAISLAGPETDTVTFTKLHEGGKVELYAVCGPGDTPKPVITVMLVGED